MTMNNSVDALGKMYIELQRRPLGLVIFESIAYAILQFLAIAGNSLTLYIIWKARHLRTTSNYFVACLAVSDLGMGVLSEHLLLATLILSRRPFGDAVCQYQGVVSITMAAASTHTLAWTAVNRYCKIVKTKHYSKIFTKRNLIAIFTFIWGSSLLASSSYLLAGNKFIFHPGKFFCYLNLEAKWFTFLLLIIYVGFPTGVIVFCYLGVFQAVRKHNAKLFKSREGMNAISVEDIRITRSLFIIVVVFVGCWTPILVIDMIDTARGTWSLDRSTYATYTFLATLSFAVNPFIYGLFNPMFRKEYLKVLKQCRCSTGRKMSKNMRRTFAGENQNEKCSKDQTQKTNNESCNDHSAERKSVIELRPIQALRQEIGVIDTDL